MRAGARANDQVVADQVVRFSPAERWLHWVNATLFIVLLITGMTLYLPALSTAVGRRVLVKDVHVYAGLLLPVPLLLAYAGSWRDSVRRDVRRFARWSDDDRRWLLSLGRRGKERLGKFNAGQKLNAIFVFGCIPLMLATGVIMRWFDPFPLAWRTGATFVHDWLAILLLGTIVGHIAKALADPIALRSMWTGRVPSAHAEKHHPRWWREVETAEAMRGGRESATRGAQGVRGAATPPADPPEGGSAVPQAVE